MTQDHRPFHGPSVAELRLARLAEKNNCDPSLLTEALAQGSLLSAQLYLEEQGVARCPAHPNQGFFSTQDSPFATTAKLQDKKQESWTPSAFFRMVKQELFLNYLELWHKKRYLARIPVFFLLLLFPLSFGSLLLPLILPLFLGCAYRFSLEGSFLAEFNPVMTRIANSFADLGKKLCKKKVSHTDDSQT